MAQIPRGDYDSPAPCWIPRKTADGKFIKPLIKCRCGQVTGIGLHHVYADGIVTASYFHSEETEFTHNGRRYAHSPGCGWHAWMQLRDYNCGDFPGEP